MRFWFRKFKDDEDGAVTVDWVVLTAGIAFVGVLIVGSIMQAATDTGTGIGAYALDVGTQALQ